MLGGAVRPHSYRRGSLSPGRFQSCQTVYDASAILAIRAGLGLYLATAAAACKFVWMYLYVVVGVKEGCNLTPFLLQVGLSVSLTHRLGQLPYPGPLPEHQRKRPQLKEPFFLFFSSFFSPPLTFFFLWWSLMKCVCVLVLLIVLFFLIIQICTFDLLILAHACITAVSYDQLLNK